MENDYFVAAVHSLKKPQDKRKLLQILIVIRKGIDDTSNKSQKIDTLNEPGCIKNLIACLQVESTSILDIALSIFGNCCINFSFARNSMKLNILHYLDRILDKHKKDSIVGRVFRIIGNLCNNICYVMIIIKEPLLIDKITGILKETSKSNTNNIETSEATMWMALRTIRKLLKRSTLKILIEKHQVLKAVGMVLIKYTNQWEINNNNENIIQEILRLLHCYSRFEHPNIIQSLKNTENGDALLCLSKLVTLNPTRVIKIITNLNKYCSLKSDLPVAAIWQTLVEKIKGDLDENSYMEYLKCMYNLIDHPSNREYMKLGDSMCQLINILKDFSHSTDFAMKCCTLILSMLSKCQYDDTLILKQINFNIVNILIEKLEWTGVSSILILIPNHVRKKRKGRHHETENTKKLKLVLDYESCSSFTENLISYEDRCASPSELSEISSDGPYSPTSGIIAEDVSDSDNYSPVCSDAEDTDINSLPSLGPMDTECATSSDEDDAIVLNEKIKYRFLHEINTLLWRYSRIKQIIMELGNPKLLITLLNITISNENLFSSHQLIMSILRKPHYLIPLMQTDFIQMVYDLTLTEHDIKYCYTCKHAYEIASAILNVLTKVAESGGGKGDIAHVLLRSNIQIKNKIIITIPYVVRNKYIINKLLINCGGLDILLNLLEKKSDVQEKSIKGLCVLAIHQLKIKNPVHNQPRKEICNLDLNSYCISDSCTNVVTFKLDDGSTVLADREFLSDKSDYFNRLLNGCFKESEQSEITLQNISTKSLKFLLILLHCNIASLGVVNIDLDTLLDLLEITERYLLAELNVYLTGCVEQLHMSNKTVPLIYQWSIESGTNILRVEAIAYALVGDIMDADRVDMFHDLINLGYCKHLRDDIQKLLVRFLR